MNVSTFPGSAGVNLPPPQEGTAGALTVNFVTDVNTNFVGFRAQFSGMRTLFCTEDVWLRAGAFNKTVLTEKSVILHLIAVYVRPEQSNENKCMYQTDLNNETEMYQTDLTKLITM